jgi:hypothetical protein
MSQRVCPDQCTYFDAFVSKDDKVVVSYHLMTMAFFFFFHIMIYTIYIMLKQKAVIRVGFEPTPPERLRP